MPWQGSPAAANRSWAPVRGRARVDEPVGRAEAAAAPCISRPFAAYHLDELAEAGLPTTSHRAWEAEPTGRGGLSDALYPAGAELVVSMPPRDYELLAESVSATRPARPGPRLSRRHMRRAANSLHPASSSQSCGRATISLSWATMTAWPWGTARSAAWRTRTARLSAGWTSPSSPACCPACRPPGPAPSWSGSRGAAASPSAGPELPAGSAARSARVTVRRECAERGAGCPDASGS